MEQIEDRFVADIDIEEIFLGNVLRNPDKLKDILSDIKLLPEAFYAPRTRAVYTEILSLHEQGLIPEIPQIQSRLNGDCPDNYTAYLANTTEAIDLKSYATRVVELYTWRKRQDTAKALLDAAKHKDLEKYSRARARADDDGVNQSSYYTPARLAHDFRAYLNQDGIEAMPLPFRTLNYALSGGLRRKQFTVLGGWSSHGKSVLVDQILSYISSKGFSAHLYMNEMGHEERVARLIASDTGISMQKLLAGNLTLEDIQVVEGSLVKLPFSITPCAGWSVDELTFDIRNKQYDIIGIDIIHQFDYDAENELARISRLLTRVAKQANCHVLATVHLNEFRANDITKPRPVSRDIRGTGMLQRDPDNIMFVYREQDPATGDPRSPSTIYFAKVRNGSLGHWDGQFNWHRMRFDLGH